MPCGSPPRLTFRELCDRFLIEKRRVRGKKTCADYRTRLAAAIEFAERRESRQRWSQAADLDREFALELREFLLARKVTANGRPGAQAKRMSPRQVYNVLECVRTMLNWASKPHIHLLPSGFASPLTADIVGEPPRKDPLRGQPFPLEFRIELVRQMDVWQLCHFALPFVLPLRPEDFASLLITDFDWSDHVLHCGTRFGGRDFNKGRMTFVTPFPPELAPLLRRVVGERTQGPLFQRRAVFAGRRKPQLQLTDGQDVAALVENHIAAADPAQIQTAQDQKRFVRGLLRKLGGVSEDNLRKEFKALLEGRAEQGSFGKLRHAGTTDLQRCGVSQLVTRYVTDHTTHDILNEYTSLDPIGELRAKYFPFVAPLVAALCQRGVELGVLGG